MDQQQLMAFLTAERQKQSEDLQAVLKTNQELWYRSQELSRRQHDEMVLAMGEQTKVLSQLLQRPSPDTGSEPGLSGAQQTTGVANPLAMLNLCKITPADAPDEFLSAFERVATAAGWPQGQWAVRLLPCLAGETLSAFQTLAPELANDYQAVKGHILEYLGYTSEHYRQRFRSTIMQEKERPKALVQKLSKLAERWLYPWLGDPRALVLEIIREQFLESVPKCLRGWVRRQGCKTLIQTLEVAEVYLDAQGTAEEERATSVQTLEKPRVTIGPGQPGKTSGYVKPKEPVSGKILTCYRCGKVGHTQRACRLRKDLIAIQGKGVRIPEEYRLVVSVAGKEVLALIDTGAEQSVTSAQLWDDLGEDLSGGNKGVPITCIHGESREYPLRNVTIEYDRKKIPIPVAVLETAPYPLILGRDWLALSQITIPTGKSSAEKCVLGSRVVRRATSSPVRRRRFKTPKAKGWRPTIRWAPLSDKAIAPTRAYSKAAGYDLYAAQEQTIPTKGRALVRTDIQVSPPPGAYLRIAPRSGLALNQSIDVSAGVIDPDYRGNVAVLLVNQGDTDYQIWVGDRVAQVICERIWHPDLVQWEHLPDTRRGQQGFGSTGVGASIGSPLPGLLPGQLEDTGAQGERLEQHAQHFEKVLDTFKEMEQDLSELKEQITQMKKEELGGMTQVIAALAQRVDGLESPKIHDNRASEGQYETPILRWPEDFEDPDPSALSQGKRFNKPRKRY
uniref:dUTP diphosphatase n=1 Tax=Geotrypetes seraphini TaxID=260995 RepID=A0A6P8QBP6_GEOSA|nr:uncharacterized protein LOC117352359 [Geotrypetes seraphini]